MSWIKISCILCIFGCFKDFRPSDSFMTDYLTGSKNFTSSEVNHEIYPVTTYSYLSTLVLMFLITDFVRYKPIIVLCGLSGIVSLVLIISGRVVWVLQIAKFFFGLFMSAEIAYYTYIYAKVDKEHYQEVTGYTKAASLLGRSMSGVAAQLTASFGLLTYHQINFLTLSGTTFATVWALFLPSVKQSIYFHRVTLNDKNPLQQDEKIDRLQEKSNQWRLLCSCETLCTCENNGAMSCMLRKLRNAYALLWKHFVQAYTNYYVIKWSAWWALSTCGYLLVATYSQLLWQTAVKPEDKIYNGAVDFLYAILGAVTVFFSGKAQLNWTVIGNTACSLLAFLEGAILLGSSYCYNIWLLYAGYIAFSVIYHNMVTVASFEVAKCISEDSHGLIFGVNIFLALLMQSLMTLIFVNTLTLDIRQQFHIYGYFFEVLSVIFIIVTIVQYCHDMIQRKRNISMNNNQRENSC